MPGFSRLSRAVRKIVVVLLVLVFAWVKAELYARQDHQSFIVDWQKFFTFHSVLFDLSIRLNVVNLLILPNPFVGGSHIICYVLS